MNGFYQNLCLEGGPRGGGGDSPSAPQALTALGLDSRQVGILLSRPAATGLLAHQKSAQCFCILVTVFPCDDLHFMLTKIIWVVFRGIITKYEILFTINLHTVHQQIAEKQLLKVYIPFWLNFQKNNIPNQNYFDVQYMQSEFDMYTQWLWPVLSFIN